MKPVHPSLQVVHDAHTMSDSSYIHPRVDGHRRLPALPSPGYGVETVEGIRQFKQRHEALSYKLQLLLLGQRAIQKRQASTYCMLTQLLTNSQSNWTTQAKMDKRLDRLSIDSQQQ